MSFIRPLLLSALISSASLFAQTAPPPAAPPATQSPADKSAAPTKEETHLSPAEAEELFKSMDDIMKFASDDSGLPIHSAIKRELDNRDQVVQYIQQKMEEDEDTKRFERTELVLKKFGMLPLDFQLKPFLLTLLREQVAGFYDSKTKTMHLLDWLPAETQRPVMAHELTHALQDQTIDLEKWTGYLTDNAKKAADPVNAEIENDEDSTARTAVVEGQGTAVMVDYILLPMGRSLENSADLVEALKKGMASDNKDMPVLAGAPILLRESLTFPYRDGLTFVQALLKAGGKKKAFVEALKDPPHDTHQILHPQDYLKHKPTPVMHMPDLTPVMGKNYEKYDVGSIGEFDLNILFKQFSDDRSATELAPQWNGGMYYAASKHTGGAKADVQNPKVDSGASSPQDLALLYVSRWSSPQSAREFADAYGRTVTKRYTGAVRKDCSGVAVDCSTWNIPNGDPVTVEAVGDQVFVSESFDEKTADALRKLILANTVAPPKADATQIRAGNLSMRVASRFFAMERMATH